MRRFILLVLLFIPLNACQEKEETIQSYKSLSILTDQGKEHLFNIEIAMTPQEQAKGLMHRTQMDEDSGMLFYFSGEAERGFWMKNTLIPLDLIFIKADGKIHHIHENAIPHDLTSIRSNGPVAAVLEINGGLSQKLGIAVGNQVKHLFFTQNKAQ